MSTFSIILLALVDGEPQTFPSGSARVHEHRSMVIRRRSEYDLARTRSASTSGRALIALDNIDEVIATIRRSRTQETARASLISVSPD